MLPRGTGMSAQYGSVRNPTIGMSGSGSLLGAESTRHTRQLRLFETDPSVTLSCSSSLASSETQNPPRPTGAYPQHGTFRAGAGKIGTLPFMVFLLQSTLHVRGGGRDKRGEETLRHWGIKSWHVSAAGEGEGKVKKGGFQAWKDKRDMGTNHGTRTCFGATMRGQG